MINSALLQCSTGAHNHWTMYILLVLCVCCQLVHLEYIPDVYNKLLTQKEIQRTIDKTNSAYQCITNQNLEWIIMYTYFDLTIQILVHIALLQLMLLFPKCIWHCRRLTALCCWMRYVWLTYRYMTWERNSSTSTLRSCYKSQAIRY